MEKEKNRKWYFLGGCERKRPFVLKWHSFRKKAVTKRACSLHLSVLGKWSFFVPIQSHQRLQKQGFPLERGFTICDTSKLCSAENTIFIVFSAKHSLAEIKECKLKKNIDLPKIRGCLPTCTKVFLVCFCLFFMVLFVSWCVLFPLKKPRKAYLFPAILAFFFVSPKGPSSKSLFSSYFVLFPCFPFVLPFKIPSYFFCFCPSTPLWKI